MIQICIMYLSIRKKKKNQIFKIWLGFLYKKKSEILHTSFYYFQVKNMIKFNSIVYRSFLKNHILYFRINCFHSNIQRAKTKKTKLAGVPIKLCCIFNRKCNL